MIICFIKLSVQSIVIFVNWKLLVGIYVLEGGWSVICDGSRKMSSVMLRTR